MDTVSEESELTIPTHRAGGTTAIRAVCNLASTPCPLPGLFVIPALPGTLSPFCL